LRNRFGNSFKGMRRDGRRRRRRFQLGWSLGWRGLEFLYRLHLALGIAKLLRQIQERVGTF
jgi:hypothetical protein